MGQYAWSGIRTLEHCSLITKLGRPNQQNGTCDGFTRSEIKNELCET